MHVVTPGWNGKLGTGGRVWPGAVAMCQLLCSMSSSIAGSHILELGTGTGAVGLYAGALGASRVILTDGSDAEVELAGLNARRHTHLFSPKARVQASLHPWGEPLDPSITAEGFDFILGADITYSLSALPALCDTLAVLGQCGRHGKAPRMILSHQGNRYGESNIPEVLGLVAEGRGLRMKMLESAADISAPHVAFYEMHPLSLSSSAMSGEEQCKTDHRPCVTSQYT